MTVCLGIVFFVFTIITILLGISACVISAGVINSDEGSDAEIQAARIILDALTSWTSELPTEI